MSLTVRKPNRALHDEIVTALRTQLDNVRQSLLDSLGFADYLAVETVAVRERGAGRIVLPPCLAGRVMASIADLGLEARRASFALRPLLNPVSGTDHRAALVGPHEGSTVVYFGITHALVEGAELATLCGDHALVGKAFGYPRCCVNAFSRRCRQDQTSLGFDSLGPYPSEMNPIVPHLFGPLTFLFHFPCSPRCAASIALRGAREGRVASLAPNVRRLSGLGHGFAIYDPELGICLVNRATPSAMLSDFEVVTLSEKARAVFQAAKNDKIEVVSHQKIRFNGTTYGGPHSFFAFFN